MRAVVQDRYGSFDLLAVRDIDKPVARDDEVLVRVQAAGLHVGDCFGVRGAPFGMRLVTGLLKPKPGIPGFDVAGQVETAGSNVTSTAAGAWTASACWFASSSRWCYLRSCARTCAGIFRSRITKTLSC